MNNSGLFITPGSGKNFSVKMMFVLGAKKRWLFLQNKCTPYLDPTLKQEIG